MTQPHVRPALDNPVAMWGIIPFTLFWGCGYALEGGYLLLVWADWLEPQDDDLSLKIIGHFHNPIPLIALFGVLFLICGILAFLSALGLLWRKAWGRFLSLLVAVLAIYLGLRSLNCGPPILEDTDSVTLGITQFLYGSLAFAILSRNRVEPVGIYILGLMNFLIGLPLALYFLMWLSEFALIDAQQRDSSRNFAALASLAGVVAGLLTAASGKCLLFARWKRFASVVSLGIAAIVAQMALAFFALLGAFVGQDNTRGGLLAGLLLIVFLPLALLLLLLSMCEAWYLKEHLVRRALQAEQ
jgi:hypothetical protein